MIIGLIITILLSIDFMMYVNTPYIFRSKFKKWIRWIPGGGYYVWIKFYYL